MSFLPTLSLLSLEANENILEIKEDILEILSEN